METNEQLNEKWGFQIWSEFAMDPLPGDILYAYYSYADYEGYAYVLYRDEDGDLWEVEASHCSCNGLEGSWSPTKVTWEYLRDRCANVKKNNYYTTFGNIIPEIEKVVNAHFNGGQEDGTPV